MSKALFAIFGNPVSHSKSPLMHNLSFQGLGFDGCYARYLLEDGEQLKETFFSLGLNFRFIDKSLVFSSNFILTTSSFFILNTPIPQNNPICNATYFDCKFEILFLYISTCSLFCSMIESFV